MFGFNADLSQHVTSFDTLFYYLINFMDYLILCLLLFSSLYDFLWGGGIIITLFIYFL